MMCVGRAEKQKRVDVCVGFLNDNKNKAEEMRQVVEEAVMILMLLTAGLRKNIGFGNWWEGSYWRVVELEIILKDAMHEITLMFCKARLREMAAMRAAREEAMEEEERANRWAFEWDPLHCRDHHLRRHSFQNKGTAMTGMTSRDSVSLRST